MTEEYVVVGRVGRAQGLRGEVLVEPRTDEPDRRFATGAVLDVVGGGTMTVLATRYQQGRLVVAFEGVEDRSTAETLRGRELCVALSATGSPEDPEEFYDHQLVGLRAETLEGTPVGEVLRVEHHAAQDLLVIARDGGELLYPFVTVMVPEVDVAGGRIVLDDRAGLLDAEL